MGEERSSAIEQFHQANDYYQKEKYSEAIGRYLDLVQRGYRDPSIFYNLGNAYFKMGELGRAILFYEKARMLLPRDDDIQKNLAYANSLAIDRIEAKSSGLFSLWQRVTDFLTLNELTIIFSVIYLILNFLGILIIRKKEAAVRQRLFQLLILFSVMFILAGGILFYRIYEFKVAQCGVITSRAVEVKSGPEPNLATLFSLHEGTTFSIHQQRGDWFQITLKNGLIGWLQSKDIQKISF
jgi:tetratricopeptide (TPR) repeat protein